MASYKYEVIDSNGKTQTGTLEAVNQEAAAGELKASGNVIVSLALADVLNKDLDIHIGKEVSARELSVFCRQFESVLRAGVTVINALDMLAEQTENKRFRAALESIRDDVQKGETLADAMEKYPKIFPKIMIHMIRAGEASGGLDNAFARMGGQFEKDAHLSGMIVKSMIYPIILILVIIVVVAVMMIRIVPTFTESFDEVGGTLPGITVAVMSISDFLVNSWYIFIIVIAAVVIFCRAFKKTDMGAMFFGRLTLKLPLIGNLSIKTASARLARTLSTLISSGIQMVDAIHIATQMMGNEIVRKAMEHAEEEVRHGIPLSKPLADSGVFPPMVYHMIEIGEETGNMEEMLDKIADYYDEEVDMATQSLLAAMEPLIIVIMALVVVPIILAIMMPMYSLYDSIG